jgi:hypothetical protein
MFDNPNSLTSGGYATINGSSCTTLGTSYISNGTTISGGLTLNNNISSMNEQVKVIVFKVTRNKHNEIKSSGVNQAFVLIDDEVDVSSSGIKLKQVFVHVNGK